MKDMITITPLHIHMLSCRSYDKLILYVGPVSLEFGDKNKVL